MPSPHEVVFLAIAGTDRDASTGDMVDAIFDAFIDAGLVIVKRPSEGKVAVACQAHFEALYKSGEYGNAKEAMAAALAAAEAADTRPRELHEDLMRNARKVRAAAEQTPSGDPGFYVDSGLIAGYSFAAQAVAEKYNLPEVNGDD